MSAALLGGRVSIIASNVLTFGPLLHGGIELRSLRQSSWDGYSVCSGLFWGERRWSVGVMADDGVGLFNSISTSWFQVFWCHPHFVLPSSFHWSAVGYNTARLSSDHIPRAGIAQSVVCLAPCPAWCSVVGSILLWASSRNHLVGLVVRRPPRERKIPGSNPAGGRIFSGSSHTSDL